MRRPEARRSRRPRSDQGAAGPDEGPPPPRRLEGNTPAPAGPIQKLEAANKLLGGNVPNLIADAPSMRPVIEMISRVAPSDANVLITGENGTGKSLVAQALHALSPRASHSMITVNMG